MTDDRHELTWDDDRGTGGRDPDHDLGETRPGDGSSAEPTTQWSPRPPAPRAGPPDAPHPHGDWSDVPWVVEPARPGDDGLPRVPTAPLRAHGDVLDVLLGLVGPERAGPPALWFVLLDADDVCLPVVLPLAEVPLTAAPAVASHVMHVLASVLDRDGPGGSVLVGLVRAAGGDRGTFETSWSPVLRDAADEHGVRVRAIAAIGASRARVIEW